MYKDFSQDSVDDNKGFIKQMHDHIMEETQRMKLYKAKFKLLLSKKNEQIFNT